MLLRGVLDNPIIIIISVLNAANVHILDGNAEDLQKECDEYEEKIKKAGGVDLFIGGNACCKKFTTH